MLRFLVNRILWMIPVLWLVATVTFFLMHMAPGGPFDASAGERNVPEGLKAAFNAKYGLDKPLHIQYLTYLGNAVQFDWGVSFAQTDRPVSEILREGLPYSARVGFIAFLISICVGVPAGVIGALRHNTWVDYASLFIATAAFTVPSFVLGVFLLLVFGLRFEIFPIAWEEGNWRSYVLPSLALGMASAAFLARLARSSILEVLRQDYVRTARSKGLKAGRVTMAHVVRNGMIPVITVLGPALAGLITGTIIIERVFNVPGMGYLYIDGIYARDYPVIMATTLLFAFMIAVGNLLVDIAYTAADPRIKLGS
jgi:ABC-type dipeptide/oligopeptide/nickel transport system permease component